MNLDHKLQLSQPLNLFKNHLLENSEKVFSKNFFLDLKNTDPLKRYEFIGYMSNQIKANMLRVVLLEEFKGPDGRGFHLSEKKIEPSLNGPAKKVLFFIKKYNESQPGSIFNAKDAINLQKWVYESLKDETEKLVVCAD